MNRARPFHLALPMKPLVLSLAALLGISAAQDVPRWTAFHAPALEAALVPLAEHRRQQGYEVELVEVSRENHDLFLQRLATDRQSPREGDVTVIAGALDPSGNALADCILPGGKGSEGRMTGKSSDGVLAIAAGKPRSSIGRLPAGTPEDLAAMVVKILNFEQVGKKADGTMACLVGNPMPGKPVRVADFFLALQTKSMLSHVNPAWRIGGAADLFFQPFAPGGADFGSAMQEISAQGWEVMAYFGHSGPEGIFTGGHVHPLPPVWSTAGGEPRGIFFTCGCHAIANQDAYAVEAMRAPGGPAAAIGPSGISYSTIGYLAGKGLVACTREKDGPPTLGGWWTTIQDAIATERMAPLTFAVFDCIDGSNGKTNLSQQRKEHLEMWSLLGDPAMRMPRSHP
jgi:hypothetical protein